MYAFNLPRMFYDVTDNHAIIIDSGTGNYYYLNVIASKVFWYRPYPRMNMLHRPDPGTCSLYTLQRCKSFRL